MPKKDESAALWMDEEILDGTAARVVQRAAMAEFFEEEDTSDKSLNSWNTFRRQAKEGLNDPDRTLLPYVTYLPELLDTQKTRSGTPDLSVLSFMRRKKAQPKTGKGGSGADAGVEEAEAEEEDDGDDVPFSFFHNRKPAHLRVKHFRKSTRGFDDDSAAVYIQKLYRTRMAKKQARRLLCKTWAKRHDTTPGISVYVNKNTGEKRWVAPVLFAHFFPNSKW